MVIDDSVRYGWDLIGFIESVEMKINLIEGLLDDGWDIIFIEQDVGIFEITTS